MGYPKETKGYYFYNKSENIMFIARDGVFLEKEHLSKMTRDWKIKLNEVREDEQQNLSDSQSAQTTFVVVVKMFKVKPTMQMLSPLPYVGRRGRSLNRIDISV